MTTQNELRLRSIAHRAGRPGKAETESVDLDDAGAVRRAIELHQAGKAVFSVPFNSAGDGTLIWLDPRDKASAG